MNKKFISGILTLALAAGVCPAGLAESSDSEERLAHRLQTQITVPYNRDGFATSAEIQNEDNYTTKTVNKEERSVPAENSAIYKTFLPSSKTSPKVEDENTYATKQVGEFLAFDIDTLSSVEGYDATAHTLAGKQANYKLADSMSEENVYAADSGGITVNQKADKLSVLFAAGASKSAAENTSIGRIDITYEGEAKAVSTYFLTTQVWNTNPLSALYVYDGSSAMYRKINDDEKSALSEKSLQDMSLNCLAEGKSVLMTTPLDFAEAVRLTKSGTRKNGALTELVVDVDTTRTISKIEIREANILGRINSYGIFNCAQEVTKNTDNKDTIEKNANSYGASEDKVVSVSDGTNCYTSVYAPVKINGIDGTYYVKVDRNGAATLGVTAISETLDERVSAADAKIANLTEYSADVWNEVQALIDEGALVSDFSNYNKLKELRETAVYGKRVGEYVEVPYNRDGFATSTEIASADNYNTEDNKPKSTSTIYTTALPMYSESGRDVTDSSYSGSDAQMAFVSDKMNESRYDKTSKIFTGNAATYQLGDIDGVNNVYASLSYDNSKNSEGIAVNKTANKLALILASGRHNGNDATLGIMRIKYEDVDEPEEKYFLMPSAKNTSFATKLYKYNPDSTETTESKKFEEATDLEGTTTADLALNCLTENKEVIIGESIDFANLARLHKTAHGLVDGVVGEIIVDVDSDKKIENVKVTWPGGRFDEMKLNNENLFNCISYTKEEYSDALKPSENNDKAVSISEPDKNGKAYSSAFLPVKVAGKEDVYYMKVTRDGSATLAVTTLSETLRERVTAANTELNALMVSETATTTDYEAMKTKIDALISEGAVKADFDKYAELEAALSTPTPVVQAITSIKLYGSDNNEVTALTVGAYTAKVTMAKKEDMAVILGAFDGSGNMLSAHIMSMTGASDNTDGSYTISDSFTVPSGTDRLTAFAFDSTANIKPLCEAKNF